MRCAIEIGKLLQLMNEIRAQMPGTKVVHGLNQGSHRPPGGNTCYSADRLGAFLGMQKDTEN
jgi:hypothetical protein